MTLLCVAFISNQTIVLAAGVYTRNISAGADVDNHSFSEPTESSSVEEVSDIFKSSLSIGSFIISILIPTLVLLFGGKELPKKHVPLYSLLFFIIIFAYRLLVWCFGGLEIVGTVYLTFLFIIASVFWVTVYNRYIVKKEDSNSEDQDIPADANSRAKAKQYIKRYIKSCHAAIESIQLYSYSVTSFENETKYWIEYIDGVKKPHVEINALLGLNLSLDTETVSEVKDIVKLYNDYNGAKDSATLKTRLRLLNTTVEQRSSKIKMRLSHLGQPEDVSVYDCCLARVLHVYCSIMASLEKETTFVGFGNNSLGLSKDIETALFAFKRTGVLGAILLQDYPYGFYYNRTGEKSGRTYCSFICNNNSINYLVLVAFKMPNNSIVPDIGVSRSLAKIREKLSKFLTIPAQGGDVL